MDINNIPNLEDYNEQPQVTDGEFDSFNVDAHITDDKVLPLSEIAERDKDKGTDRFSTGFVDFDEVMEGGFKEGDLVVISGISGEGKSSYGQTLTYNLCNKGIPTLWFSYEVSAKHLDKKFRKMGIDQFYHVYTPEKNTTGKLEWIKYKIKESYLKYMTKVVIIDHIDFLTPTDIKNSDNETIALKKITTELKTLAIKLNMTIIIMAHLKKLPEGKEPDMQDIGHSAGIFQLADYVFMIWREKEKRSFGSNKFKNSDGDLVTNKSVIKIVKNRETGQLKYIVCRYIDERFIKETKIEEPVEPFEEEYKKKEVKETWYNK